MLNFIDSYLNKITMYRLVLYFLIVLIAWALVLSAFGNLPFKPLDLVLSTFILLLVCWATNKIFSKVYGVPANVESVYITALILALIITPSQGVWLLFWAGVISMAVKYILAFQGKHFFNPAAFAVVVTAYTLGYGASWWIGTMYMLPLVMIGGFLVTRKIQRFDLVLSFLAIAILGIIIASPSRNQPLFLLEKILVDSPIIFFATIMLTEPLTTPSTKWRRMGYGVLVGLLFGPAFHIGPIYTIPELALLVGNLFSYAVSPKAKYLMTLKSKKQEGANTFNFAFEANRKIKFQPGQYLEWTLGHKNSDTRGNRRYFTIASSPTETDVHLGVKFYENSSSFKQAMVALNSGDQVLAGQLSGDFTLPRDKNQKLVFIAGGIGVTPFRSMIKYLLDKNEKRDIVMFYSNKETDQPAYKDLFDHASVELGFKIAYVSGRLAAETIQIQAPDFLEREFYISGPHGMVVAFEKTLKDLGVPASHIKIDFFPGFA